MQKSQSIKKQTTEVVTTGGKKNVEYLPLKCSRVNAENDWKDWSTQQVHLKCVLRLIISVIN